MLRSIEKGLSWEVSRGHSTSRNIRKEQTSMELLEKVLDDKNLFETYKQVYIIEYDCKLLRDVLDFCKKSPSLTLWEIIWSFIQYTFLLKVSYFNGLIKAVDNFDSSYGVMFSTYAVPLILGEVKRLVRTNSSVRVVLKVSYFKLGMTYHRIFYPLF